MNPQPSNSPKQRHRSRSSHPRPENAESNENSEVTNVGPYRSSRQENLPSASFRDLKTRTGQKPPPRMAGRLKFTFYDFPAQHWSHLRTTNPIESTFATVRLRTQRTKGCGSRIATLTMVYKLGLEAQKAWRRLNGADQIAKVITGVRFADGVESPENQQAA